MANDTYSMPSPIPGMSFVYDKATDDPVGVTTPDGKEVKFGGPGATTPAAASITPSMLAPELAAQIGSATPAAVVSALGQASLSDLASADYSATATTAADVNAALAAVDGASKRSKLYLRAPSGQIASTRVSPGNANQLGAVRLRKGISFDGGGATFVMNDNAAHLSYLNMTDAYGYTDPYSVVTADVAAGGNQVIVADGSIFAVGESVVWRLADEPTDNVESAYFGFSKVSAKAGNVLTLSTRFPKASNISVVNNVLNKAVHKVIPLEGVTVGNFRAIEGGSGNCEELVTARYIWNSRFHDIYSQNVGAGLFLQYSHGVTIDNVVTDGSRSGGVGSKGRSLNFAECRGIVVNNWKASNCEGSTCFVEASSEVMINGAEVSLGLPWNGNNGVFTVVQNSRVTARNVNISGAGGYVLVDDGGTGGTVEMIDSSVSVASECKSIGNSNNLRLAGSFRYAVSGSDERYNIDETEFRETRVNLVDSMYNYFQLGTGLLLRAEVYVPSTWAAEDTSAVTIYLGRRNAAGDDGNNGGSLSSTLQAGKFMPILLTFGTDGGPIWTRRDLPLALLVGTPASGYAGAGKYVLLRTWTVANRLAAPQAISDASAALYA